MRVQLASFPANWNLGTLELLVNSLTVGYLLEVFIGLWIPSIWSVFSLLLRDSTGNLSQGFIDTFPVGSRPWTHPQACQVSRIAHLTHAIDSFHMLTCKQGLFSRIFVHAWSLASSSIFFIFLKFFYDNEFDAIAQVNRNSYIYVS